MDLNGGSGARNWDQNISCGHKAAGPGGLNSMTRALGWIVSRHSQAREMGAQVE